MTDVCADIKTLSQMLLLCERRFANAVTAEDAEKAGKWAAVAEAILTALRSKSAS